MQKEGECVWGGEWYMKLSSIIFKSDASELFNICSLFILETYHFNRCDEFYSSEPWDFKILGLKILESLPIVVKGHWASDLSMSFQYNHIFRSALLTESLKASEDTFSWSEHPLRNMCKFVHF